MANGTLKVSNIQTSSGSGTITIGQSGETVTSSAAMGSGMGKVLQVVQATYSTQVTHTTSYADTGLTASITPSSTSNKVLILINQHVFFSTNGLSIKIVRNSTDIFVPPVNYTLHNNSGTGNPRMYYPIQYLDSPSSTSSTVYKTQAILHSSGTIYTQADNNYSTITLMEIAV